MLSSAIWSVPLAAVLAYAPHFARIALVIMYGKLDNSKPRSDQEETAKMPKHLQEIARRLRMSHLNQLETLGFYAGAVAVAVAARVPPAQLARLTSNYIKCRFAFNLAYAAPQVGKGVLRSLAFIASIISCFIIYGAAARAASDFN